MMRCNLCFNTAGGCNGACQNTHTYPIHNHPGTWPIPPKGCICPPGSEKTCERSDCGRKDYKAATPPRIVPEEE